MPDEDAEDYLLRNSPGFWRLIESRRAQADAGQVASFDADAYAGEVPAATAHEADAPSGSGRQPKTGKRTSPPRAKR